MDSASTTRIHLARVCNEAADRIDAGDLKGGLACLKNALSASKALIRRQQEEQRGIQAFSRCRLDQIIIFETITGDRCKDHDVAPFFCNPVRLLESSCFLITEAITTEMIATVIVFNLGVATHLASATDCLNFDEGIRRAVSLFECAFNLHSANSPVCGSSMFQMAVLNNLAYSHLVLGDVSSSEAYYKGLLSALMCVIDGHPVTATSYNEIIRCFFCSANHQIFSKHPRIAAAA